MGDRNNPIKFGPEWLRNLSRERSAVRSSNNQAGNSNTGGTAAGAAAGPSGGAAASNSASNNVNNTHNTAGPSKILLAKLRYGREEMLALYDRNSEAPPELKVIDTLYQPRGKQPLALNNTFEDDMRDMRSAPPVGGMSSADRYGMGRGAGRGGPSTGRGTGARTYSRPSTTGRGAWHVSNPRTPSYGGGADDDGGQMRPWSNNNTPNRNSGDQTDWANKTYRSKRQGNNTNWRQHPSREEGEEWRSSEPGRSRQLEKWDRDWGERPGLDKSQSSWNNNRRTWVGGDTHSNENLPEWIGENAECGGTFDSQGAFHGYSNDDTNLPKNQDAPYPLTRSHTHSSFARSKTVEEGSDEWWASEKAKKLSPKRFDASDIKFKKQPMTEVGTSASTSKEYGNKSSTSKDESQKETPEQLENTATAPEPPESNNSTHQNEDKYAGKNVYKTKYAESKTFDAKMRSDINMDEANDERGNFQSVLIAPNNSLRQKHQNMVPANEPSNKSSKSASSQNKSDVDHGAHKSPDDVLVVNNMFRLPYDELEILSPTSPNSSSLLTLSNTGMPVSLGTSASTITHQNPNMKMNMSIAGMPNQGLGTIDPNINKQNMQTSGHETTGMQAGMQPQVMPTSGMQQGKPAGLHNTGMPQHGVQNPGMPSGGMQNPVISQVRLPNTGKHPGMQNPGMPSGLNSRMPIQNPGMGRGVLQNPGMHTVGLQNQAMATNAMHSPRISNPSMQSSMIQQGGITNSALNASLGLPIGPSANMGLPLQNVQQPAYPNVDNIGVSMAASGMQGAISNASMQPGGNMPGFQAGNAGNSSLFLGQNSNSPSMSSSSDIPMPNHTGQNSMFPMHGLQHSGSQGAFGNNMYSNNMPNPAEQWYYEDPESNIQGPFPTRDMLNWYRAGFFSATLMVRRACETSMRPLGSYGPVPFATMDMMPQYPMPGNYEARAQGGHDTMLNTQPGLGLDAMKMNVHDNPPGEHIQFGFVRQMRLQSFNQPQPMVMKMNIVHDNPPVEHVPLGTVRQVGIQSFNQPPPPMVIKMNIPDNPPVEHIQFGTVKQMTIQSFNQSQPMVMKMNIVHDNPPVEHVPLGTLRQVGIQSFNQPPPPMVIKMNIPDNPPVEPVQLGPVRQMGIKSFNQPPPMVDLLWSQTSNDLRWMHNSMNESRVNNLSMFFWDQQPSAIASNALLPEEITKEMKTEDQILAQLRASQNMGPQQPPLPFMEPAAVSAAASAKTDDRFAAAINATPNLEELHRLMQKDALTGNPPAAELGNNDTQPKTDKVSKPEPSVSESNVTKTANTSKTTADLKPAKQKTDNDKTVKSKENNNTKSKGKKNKDEKKDEVAEVKTKEDEVIKAEKRSQESSPSKNKKEDKSNKKELEREKKEWIKEGFTIVKGTEKTVAKDGKKKAEEARAAEEAERKRKEEEKLAVEEEKRKKQAESQKKQQEQQPQQQRQPSDTVAKKAPWSAAANLTLQAVHRDGLTLAEIQRLEREKKLEQMKEQQQMMQIIAQQQAAALAREQEMQAGLGWAKKKGNNFNAPGQSLTEIQAEARKQAVAAAAVAVQVQTFEEQPPPTAPQTNHVPWANTHNGGGFWDTPPNQPPKQEKPQEPAKPAEASKAKKKITLSIPTKKETTPAAEFETWCASFLTPWSAKIDVPTFIGFLKDIESPYEVKDYVKCYLGDSKESNDFARQFLERRSKLLRVGMVTPSDDLCSPAMAVNPRTLSGSDYQEVKGKGKKSKKNKMLKIDARILGFSVTAAEDRINVGDIDSV